MMPWFDYVFFILRDTMMKHLSCARGFLLGFSKSSSVALSVLPVKIDIEIKYHIFQYAQRTHAQSVLPEHACEAMLC